MINVQCPNEDAWTLTDGFYDHVNPDPPNKQGF